MTEWAILRERMLADPAVRAEYDALADEFALVEELIKARAHSGLTQEEIARRMGTTQSVVARLESGRSMPSTRTLKKYAEATGMKLVIRFEPAA
jgi:ribosome-binding protein aMBF1 (putative translation factor)